MGINGYIVDLLQALRVIHMHSMQEMLTPHKTAVITTKRIYLLPKERGDFNQNVG
jgi:hypothetical protein